MCVTAIQPTMYCYTTYYVPQKMPVIKLSQVFVLCAWYIVGCITVNSRLYNSVSVQGDAFAV